MMIDMTPMPVLTPHAAVPSEPIYRLSVAQYHDMIRTGILTEDDPVELLDGWLVPKMPKNPSHRVATRLTQKGLERVVPAGWYVDSQEPITTDSSEPEPDAMIVRGDTRQYLERHPGPQDLGMVAEVSATSLQRDRGSKLRIYARARIPVYWIVNLVDRQVEVYTDPTGPAEIPAYRKRVDYRGPDSIPLVLDGTVVAQVVAQDLLP